MEVQFPNLSDRIQSSFIDIIFVILLMFGLTMVFDKFQNVPDWIRASAFIGLFVIYEPLSITLGCTVGNFLKGIRVRRSSNPASKLSIFRSLIRFVIKIILGWYSFLTLISHPQKRAVHDLASGSLVVKV